MRKVALALVGTVVGLVLLLSYKSHPLAGATVAASGDQPKAGPSDDSSSQNDNLPPSPSAAPSQSPSGTASKKAAPPAKPAAPATRTITGDAVDTDYGTVQVRVTMTGSRITNIVNVQLPNDRPRSQEISSFAGPQLRSEALAAQSANIDAVSGASYTSAGYVKSLQSALDKARS